MKYEVKNVEKAGEIQKAHKTAIESNKKYYRAISVTGKIYGMVNGHHEIANDKNAVLVDGEYWFVNEKYVDENAQVEETKKSVKETVEKVDYKALYEEGVSVNKKLTKELNAVKQELQKVKGEFADYKAIVEAFKKL